MGQTGGCILAWLGPAVGVVISAGIGAGETRRIRSGIEVVTGAGGLG
jgi:hypothetical protein